MNDRTTSEKIEIINRIINYVCSADEFGTADLIELQKQAYRHNLSPADLQKYIAILQARGEVSGQIVGHSFYIIPKNLI